ncbi:phosphodiester glycosidase family protein [Streptomyces genisteinicus]|uniref:Phosphodiester glycosidase family protein n=1 Tax=Streptomyces genisteinicus TaxID=2768068 RepID=A0A7H0HR26_9ACTN|nr:phosphodiester glycosidase family protein [Streptomyces genisteinicus]QNP62992.1 phosphodiester glycosidase family protein [Streptomyces genisteinicus]
MQRTSLSLAAATAAATVLGAVAAVPGAQAAPQPPDATRPQPPSATRPLQPSAPPVTTTVAPGVTLTSMAFGRQDADDKWTVHVYLPVEPDGPLSSANTALGPRATADRVAAALRDKGFAPRVEEIRTPDFADRRAGTLGWTVRIGRYAAEAGASADLARVKAAGFAGGTRYTPQDGSDLRAPHKVHVMRVDLRSFGGSLDTAFGPTLKGTEKLTDLMAAAGATAGVNAQWFYNDAPGGLYVKDGRIIGSATQGRAGIRFSDGGRAFDVDTFRARVTLRAGGATAEIDGVNRIPGEVWNCGGVGGDLPTEKPQHDLKCTDDSELVRFTPEWGQPPSGAGAEAVLDASGRVIAVNASRGAAVPAGGSVIQATGASAAWLLAHLPAGTQTSVTEEVWDSRNSKVPLTAGTTILQVGPALVRDGRVSVNAVGDGILREGPDRTFTYNWTVRANPRSMIGVDDRGRLMIVVVDGRQAGYSEGLGIASAAQLMRQLGAREAMNLDGGGSSVMATASAGIVNRPSDSTGQRALGTVLLLRP